MQIHQGRRNVIKALQAKNPNEQQNSTQTVAAGQETKANAQEHTITIQELLQKSNRL